MHLISSLSLLFLRINLLSLFSIHFLVQLLSALSVYVPLIINCFFLTGFRTFGISITNGNRHAEDPEKDNGTRAKFGEI